MISFGRYFLSLLREESLGGLLFDSFREMYNLLSAADWARVMKIVIFIALAVGLTIALLVANDKIFDHYNAKRIKKHHLTIRNNGNVPSIFLFRTIDLPKQLAIRFRIGDVPMIWVSRKETAIPRMEEVKPAEQAQVSGSRKSSETSLVPDLRDPFSNAADTAGKVLSDARKAVTDTGKKAGLFAGIIGSVTNLFGVKSDILQDAQGALKDVQQQAGQTIQTVNSRIGTADTLANQAGSFFPSDGAKNAISGIRAPGSFPGMDSGEAMAGDRLNLSQSAWGRDLVFDEDVWRSNIGKVDEKGGDLNYAMSKTLEPGESLKIDLDIMNISNSSAPISLMYKIEVVQVPQTKLQLAAPKEYVNGIVIYPKIPLKSTIMPYAMIIALIVISLQLLAGYSHLIF